MAERGYDTVPEAAIDVIQTLQMELGMQGQAPWRLEHPDEFQRRIIQLQCRREMQAAERANGPVFLDRGRPDGVAYCLEAGVEVPSDIDTLCQQARYDYVFLLDTLTEFTHRPDTGRIGDADQSRRVRDHMLEVYRRYGYDPIVLPETSISERVQCVLETAGLA